MESEDDPLQEFCDESGGVELGLVQSACMWYESAGSK